MPELVFAGSTLATSAVQLLP